MLILLLIILALSIAAGAFGQPGKALLPQKFNGFG